MSHSRGSGRQSDAGSDLRRAVLLSVADIVAIYGVSRSFAYGLKRVIPHYKFGGLKFRREDIESFLERERRVVPPLQNALEPPRGQTTGRRGRRPPRARSCRQADDRDARLRERYGV